MEGNALLQSYICVIFYISAARSAVYTFIILYIIDVFNEL